MTHIYHPPDFPDVSRVMNAKESFPWALDRLMNKETVILPEVENAPLAAARDLENWQHFGIKSIMVFPLCIGDGVVFGALAFHTLKEKDWSEDIINRLQIVSQIFANALNRKFTEKDLLESKMRFQLATDSANAGLWSWDFKTNIIWVTEKTRSLYGFKLDEEITGDNFFNKLHPDDVAEVSRVVEHAFKSGAVVRIEYRIVLPDKSVHWMSVRAQAFLKPSGEPQNMTGVSLDITKIKHDEIERIDLRNELAHFSRIMTMNELSTSLAHEINQPLGAILNNASAAKEVMSHGADVVSDINEILTDIIQDAKRAGDVVRKIRGMVKKEEVKIELVNMNTLIINVAELFQNNFRINGVSFQLDLNPNQISVKGEGIHLQQVLVNVVMNALEAMEGTSSRMLLIRLAMTGSDVVTVSVSDSGKGIDAVHKDSLFASFFTTKKDGLGMGLSICKSIIEGHGGRIWAENNPVTGATVSFSLKVWRGDST
jgi:PAS domain S-box-containing protein